MSERSALLDSLLLMGWVPLDEGCLGNLSVSGGCTACCVEGGMCTKCQGCRNKKDSDCASCWEPLPWWEGRNLDATDGRTWVVVLLGRGWLLG